MPTSGTVAWPLTARDIITAALDENGILPLGREPTAIELDKCVLRLNALLKSLPAGSHREATGTVTIPADDPSGSLAEGIEEIVSARLVLPSGSERMMFRASRDHYFMLPNKAQSGEPTLYYTAEQLAGLHIYVWPVPTAQRTMRIEYVRRLDVVTNASQEVDFPSRYTEALYANLAVRCAGMFGVQPSPELASRAFRLEREMLDADRPDAYFFEADGSCQIWGW